MSSTPDLSPKPALSPEPALSPRLDVAVRSLPLIIASGCLIAMISFGPRSAIGVFLAPMSEARGWSREAISFAVAIQNLLWGVGQPFAGMIADRWGTGRVLVAGGLLYAAGLLLAAWAESSFLLQIGLGVLIGLALAACSFSIVLSAFGRAVTPAQRSLAFGVGTAAGSLGQFLFAPLSIYLIGAIGWQGTLELFAGLTLAIALLAWPLRGKGHPAAPGQDQTVGAALHEALGYRSFVLLAIGFFVCGFHVAFITVHLPPYIVDMGLDPRLGGWAIAFIGLFNIFGSLAAGAIGQRFAKQKSLAVIYFARSIVIFGFIMIPISPVTVLVFAAAMGFLWLSTVPLTSGLIAGMFGVRYMGMLFGVVFFSHQIGSFIGVWMGGWLYDVTGSYDGFWWAAIALGVIAGLINLPIRETPVARLQPA